MGLRMRFILLTLGSIVPSCLLISMPTLARAEQAESPHESISETAATILPANTNIFQATAAIALTPIDLVSTAPSAIAIQPTQADSIHELHATEAIPAESKPFDNQLVQLPAADAENSETNSEANSEAIAPSSSDPEQPEPQAPDSQPIGSESTESESIESESVPDAPVIDDEAVSENGEESDADDVPETESEATPTDELTTEEEDAAYLQWQQLLMEGDRLFLNGQYLEAEQRYQAAKDPDDTDPDPVEQPEAFTDPELLSPAGRVYWREYQAGQESGMETRIFIPLQLLTEEHPEFVPAQVEYAVLLSDSDDEDAKQQALEQLEQATALFPENAELARTRVNFLAENEEWLQAAIAARQFAVLNPDAPENPEFEADSEEYQQRFRSRLRGQLRRNAIGNVVTGALGFVLTGNLFGPLSALDTTVLMLRGESAVGENIANRAVEELDLITDEEVVAYVNEIGQTLASLAGRDEFEYEFYVVEEEELNAFALPGGKVFINAGAILRAETEAELAGLIAHELSHAVLSHGFQIVTGGNLTANVLQHVPYGGYVTNLAVLRYSRGMERQADTLGTQLLANSDYAADGLHRMMETLYDVSEYRRRFDWLSSHPDIPERIRRLDQLIEQNGYNRYAYEGIERHLQIREQVEQLLREAGKLEDEEEFEIEDTADDSSETSEESESQESEPKDPMEP
ncbi:MAG: M48 family metalloprotease [Elainellaceae cyanobacterium]